MTRRLAPLSVLAAGLVAGLAAGQGAWAQDRPGLYLDPQQLPPDTRPGECVTRRITGPGGAYRWDRVECAGETGASDWGHGRQPLQVQDGSPRGDRYGGWRYDQAYDGRGYDQWDPAGYAAYPIYRVAGTDAYGFLVWPGKRP